MPLTTRPRSTSRQGMIRLASIVVRWIDSSHRSRLFNDGFALRVLNWYGYGFAAGCEAVPLSRRLLASSAVPLLQASNYRGKKVQIGIKTNAPENKRPVAERAVAAPNV